MPSTDQTSPNRRQRFRELHREGTFVMPNPFDAGSAKLLAALDFPALATTSGGFAATLGKADMSIARDLVVDHVALLTAATDLPLNVDAERCFADDVAGVAETVRMLGEVGAAGCSIEDWNPAARAIDPMPIAVARVAAAADAARAIGIVLTARCENHLHGIDDLDDTITRLIAYVKAGAEVVYAPGLVDIDRIRRVVDETAMAVNVLLLTGGPTVAQLATAGVRRVSVGGQLARVAYGAVVAAARELQQDGQFGAATPFIDNTFQRDAFR